MSSDAELMKLVGSGTASRLEKLSLAAFESAGEAIVVTDLDGTIQYVNPAFEKITGYQRDEAVGQNPRLLKSGKHPPAFYKRLWDIISSGHVWQGRFINRRKDGILYQAEQTIAPVIDAQGRPTGYVSIQEDITDRVQSDEAERRTELQHVQDAADERVRLARQDLELARTIQRRLFPQGTITLPGFDVAGAVFPAEETCGDYYDFIRMPGGRLGIALGDVSGHGVGPAILMAETRAYLRASCQAVNHVDEILRRINQFLVRDLEGGRFVSLFFGILDPQARSLVYCTAGQPAYHLHTAGTVTRLNNSGMVLGLIESAEFPPGEVVPLSAGDLIFIATDGLHETHNDDGAMVGNDRILEFVQVHRHLRARNLIDELYASTCRFRQHACQQDDITVVIVKVECEE